MPFVEVCPSREFRLVFGGSPNLAVPPGAAAVQVISNLRGADRAHWQSIAQIFYARNVTASHRPERSRVIVAAQSRDDDGYIS